MLRKRKNPTPAFGLPPPFNPMTGEFAKLTTPGIYPSCALVEVAAADTHDDYVICRGYDTRDQKFYEYDLDEGKPGIPVAKPFGKRAAGLYAVGEVYAAFLPQSLIGQNSGTIAAGSTDLLDLEILETDDGEYINWMLVEGKAMVRFEMTAALTVGGEANAYMIVRNAADNDWERQSPELTFSVHDFQSLFAKPATPGVQTGAYGIAIKPMDQPDWEIVNMQIPRWVYFELLQALTRAGTGPVTAAIDFYMGYNPDTAEANISVYDETSLFQGDSDGATGDHGIAEWNVRSSRWEIRYMEPNLNGGTTFDVTVPGGTRSLTVPSWVTVGAVT